MAREVVWQMIQGNPAIKSENKPNDKEDIYKLGIDKKKTKKKEKVVTPEELEAIRQQLLKSMK